MFHVPERNQVQNEPKFYSDSTYGNNGLFKVRVGPCLLRVIASDGAGWEHVSVSLPNRCPSWEEMCAIKDLFWGAEDVVVQFHPRKSEYVSWANYCLHLWRAIGVEFPTPHSGLVGPKKGQSKEECLREARSEDSL